MPASERVRVAALSAAALLALGAPLAAAEPVDLLAGAAVSFAMGDAPPDVSAPPALALEQAGDHVVTCRYVFTNAPPAGARFLSLEKHADVDLWRLNGAPVGPPPDGLRRRLVAGIPAGLLRPGTNVLEAVWRVHIGVGAGRAADIPDPGENAGAVIFAARPPVRVVAEKAEARAALRPVLPAELAVRTGPILGDVARDGFSVSVRLNAPASVTLAVGGREVAASPEGLDHQLRAEGLAPGAEHAYELTATTPGADGPLRIGPFTARTLPAGDSWTFAVVGDSRSNPSDWARVAAAIGRERPLFVVHTGDLVNAGRNEWEWETQFWAPARELLATVPVYAAAGNHEQRSPLMPALVPMRGGWTDDWSCDLGPLLLIGIDTTLPGWQPGGPRHRRMDAWLRGSRAPFVVCAGHYPPWSSGQHGEVDAEGRPVEKPMETARVDVMPLLARHGAQAFVVGHDHNYERSEPPEGVTVVVAGGGGAPLRPARADAAAVNPHSKVFASEMHYAVFVVDAGAMKMSVRGLDGREIDARAWSPRALAAEPPAAPPLPAETPPVLSERPAP
jgi:predicted phosphodiesterase